MKRRLNITGTRWERNGRAIEAIEDGLREPNTTYIGSVEDDLGGVVEWQGNADLMAAAPDLYNALEAAAVYCERLFGGWGFPDDRALWEQMRAALAKAHGT